MEIKLEEEALRIEFDPEEFDLIKKFFPVFKRIIEGYMGLAIRTVIVLATSSEEKLLEMATDIDFTDPAQVGEFGARLLGGSAGIERLMGDKFNFTAEELDSLRRGHER